MFESLTNLLKRRIPALLRPSRAAWLIAATGLVGALLTASPAHAQVAISSVTTFHTPAADAPEPFSFQHTVSGTNRYLLLALSSKRTESNEGGGTITAATWTPTAGAPQALSLINTTENALAEHDNTQVSEMWGLVAPAVGTGTITVTIDTAGTTRVVAGAITFVNINQATPVGHTVTQSQGPVSPNEIFTATFNTPDPQDAIIDNIMTNEALGTATPGAGQTQLWKIPITGTNAVEMLGASTTKLRTGATTTVSWDVDGKRVQFVGVVLQGLVGPTAVRLDSFTAAQTARGTSLQWRTGMEANNLGFNVYREDAAGRTKLNDTLIAGSALLSRGALSAGHEDPWVDSGSPAAAYWLEDIDLNGKKTWHGPFQPYLQSSPLPGTSSQSPTFGQLASKAGNGQTRQASLIVKPRRDNKSIQAQLAALSTIKIGVKESGWYRVGADQLQAAGLGATVPSRLLRLFVDGNEVPIVVVDGGDGRLGKGDSIQFYGTGLDAPYSDERVYWLTTGAGAGSRIRTVTGSGTGSSSSFLYTAELRERLSYISAITNGEADNFFGDLVFGGPVDQILDLEHVAATQSGQPTLQVNLQGFTSLEGGPDHKVLVQLNGTTIGQVIFDGTQAGSLSVSVPASLIHEGSNVVTLTAQGGPLDASFVESIRISYWHDYTAEDGTLQFTATPGHQVTVDGFEGSNLAILDVTNPDSPRFLASGVSPAAHGFAVSASVPAGGTLNLIALSDEVIQAPTRVTPNTGSRLAQTTQKADLVIIGPSEFLPALEALKVLREGQRLKVALVDVEDVYDEFSFGSKSPFAIREFLARVSSGKRGPKYVLLAGDASTDPRNFQNAGHKDIVPTKLIDTALMETASDDWFVDFNSDGLPELAIGRLPAGTLAELELMVAKTVAYERGPAVGGTLLVADLNEGFNFEAASDQLEGLVPGGSATKLYRSQTDAATVYAALNQGYGLVNFAGHGSTHLWRGLLSTNEAVKLQNGSRLSFVAAMDCLNGQFHNIYLDTIAEALLKAPNGGAVAVWASSGTTSPVGQAAMNKAFVQTLFSSTATLGKTMTLGEAAMRAKAATTDPDVRRTWVFFGDPTARLR